MQKGTSLTRLKPQAAPEPTLSEPKMGSPVVDPENPDIAAWANAVLNASSSATKAYADVANRSIAQLTKPKKGVSNTSFLYKHWSLVVAVAFLLVLIVVVAMFDWRWEVGQKVQEHDSNLAAQTESFSLDLVRHLLPSAKVDRHQFRGFTRKPSSITLGFEDLGLEIPGAGKVLEGVSGEFKAGRMTIILGPSGAGKTTFMNVLAGKATYGTMCGKILVNGLETKLSEFKSVMGFVPQDDIVHEKLTVREQIQFSALLRNEVGTDASTLCRIVDDVLAVLQIEHIQRSIVGGVSERGISGGQRERVNVGLELASFPTLLFLDEPTSGLDSTSSLALVKSLKKMTQLGITIVVVAHQPRWSLFTLFDDVLILAKGGKTAYMGSSANVCPYFEDLGFKKPPDENLADWFMDIVSGCVANAKFPKFSSDMLASSWIARDRSADNKPRMTREATRVWTSQDDRAVLGQTLEEEWAKVDIKRSGSLGLPDLFILLSNTAGETPSEEVTSELA